MRTRYIALGISSAVVIVIAGAAAWAER